MWVCSSHVQDDPDSQRPRRDPSPPENESGARRGAAESIAAPHLIDVEIAQVLRRYAAASELDDGRGRQALDDLGDFPLVRYPHEPLLSRIWELRHSLTAYDAAYVALAEALGATLLTRDAGLARAPGHEARVELT
jgi:predicted nucleic acid-binding protein